MRENIARNDIYWFLDQVVLDQLVADYNKGLLPMSYIDWAMRGQCYMECQGQTQRIRNIQKEQVKYL
jgi:hypothetical protein